MTRNLCLRLDLNGIDRSDAEAGQADPAPLCPLCGRTIPAGARASRHHLTPKLKGGAKRGTILLHQICHSAIHARFSEAEIARRLSDIDSLKGDSGMAEFLAWVRTKPDDFHARTASTRRKGPGTGRSNRVR